MGIVASKYPTALTTAEDLHVQVAGYRKTVNLSICNQGASVAKVRVFLSKTAANAAPSNFEAIEWDTPIAAAGSVGNVLERTALTLDPGDKICIYSSSLTVSFVLYGIEELK
jgi:hypothetical protein